MELVTINKYRMQSSKLNTLLRPKALNLVTDHT